MTYDARRASFRRQDAWVAACKKSLCGAYNNCCGTPYLSMGTHIEEKCNHQWCHGILDVVNQAHGNEHVSYQIPLDGDSPWTEKKEKEYSSLTG